MLFSSWGNLLDGDWPITHRACSRRGRNAQLGAPPGAAPAGIGVAGELSPIEAAPPAAALALLEEDARPAEQQKQPLSLRCARAPGPLDPGSPPMPPERRCRLGAPAAAPGSELTGRCASVARSPPPGGPDRADAGAWAVLWCPPRGQPFDRQRAAGCGPLTPPRTLLGPRARRRRCLFA
jgi:hypothetical protein